MPRGAAEHGCKFSSDVCRRRIYHEVSRARVRRFGVGHCDDDIDVEALFIKEDSTEQVHEKRAEIVRDMEAAEYLNCETLPIKSPWSLKTIPGERATIALLRLFLSQPGSILRRLK